MPKPTPTPTQLAVICRMGEIGCPVTERQALHGVRRARFSTLAALRRLGLIEDLNGWADGVGVVPMIQLTDGPGRGWQLYCAGSASRWIVRAAEERVCEAAVALAGAIERQGRGEPEIEEVPGQTTGPPMLALLCAVDALVEARKEAQP